MLIVLISATCYAMERSSAIETYQEKKKNNFHFTPESFEGNSYKQLMSDKIYSTYVENIIKKADIGNLEKIVANKLPLPAYALHHAIDNETELEVIDVLLKAPKEQKEILLNQVENGTTPLQRIVQRYKKKPRDVGLLIGIEKCIDHGALVDEDELYTLPAIYFLGGKSTFVSKLSNYQKSNADYLQQLYQPIVGAQLHYCQNKNSYEIAGKRIERIIAQKVEKERTLFQKYGDSFLIASSALASCLAYQKLLSKEAISLDKTLFFVGCSLASGYFFKICQKKSNITSYNPILHLQKEDVAQQLLNFNDLNEEQEVALFNHSRFVFYKGGKWTGYKHNDIYRMHSEWFSLGIWSLFYKDYEARSTNYRFIVLDARKWEEKIQQNLDQKLSFYQRHGNKIGVLFLGLTILGMYAPFYSHIHSHLNKLFFSISKKHVLYAGGSVFLIDILRHSRTYMGRCSNLIVD